MGTPLEDYVTPQKPPRKRLRLSAGKHPRPAVSMTPSQKDGITEEGLEA